MGPCQEPVTRGSELCCVYPWVKKNGPHSDVLSCLFAAPFGVSEGPVLIDTWVTDSLVFLYLLPLPCSLSFFLFSWDFSGQSLFSQSSPGHTEH